MHGLVSLVMLCVRGVCFSFQNLFFIVLLVLLNQHCTSFYNMRCYCFVLLNQHYTSFYNMRCYCFVLLNQHCTSFYNMRCYCFVLLNQHYTSFYNMRCYCFVLLNQHCTSFYNMTCYCFMLLNQHSMYKFYNVRWLASFPGPAQLSVACKRRKAGRGLGTRLITSRYKICTYCVDLTA